MLLIQDLSPLISPGQRLNHQNTECPDKALFIIQNYTEREIQVVVGSNIGLKFKTKHNPTQSDAAAFFKTLLLPKLLLIILTPLEQAKQRNTAPPLPCSSSQPTFRQPKKKKEFHSSSLSLSPSLETGLRFLYFSSLQILQITKDQITISLNNYKL